MTKKDCIVEPSFLQGIDGDMLDTQKFNTPEIYLLYF